jgi:hypothetical protein
MTTPFDAPEGSIRRQSGTQRAAKSEPATPERPAGAGRVRASWTPPSMMTVALIVAMLMLLLYTVPAVFLGVDEVATFLNLAR